ncbi:MAG: hypothetical protein H6698_06965 [Myxococcales bacterium]|nr:hypothetical protein [Myxococcales bacterium]MCB9531440.1 hypothetical protein [Myxococcales bacterium]MCB9534049.1 hypothetical protein [Myxococcales bacterium]
MIRHSLALALATVVAAAHIAACSDDPTPFPGTQDVAADASTDVAQDTASGDDTAEGEPDTVVAPDVDDDAADTDDADETSTEDPAPTDAAEVDEDTAPVLSCADRCGAEYDPEAACQCNDQCFRFGNCCPDACDVCAAEVLPGCDPANLSCSGRCDVEFDPSLPCQCNDVCADHDNCCDDYDAACGCAPQCDGRSCGDDGCGGTCGTCEAGDCVDGTCVVECVPECAGWQSCSSSGSCVARSCASQGQCPGGYCFQGTCRGDGTCASRCAAVYGASHSWSCINEGYCQIADCGNGSDCGASVDCVSESEHNTRGPGGAGLFDRTCVPARSSPCGGTCNGLCSAASGRCSG